MSRIPNFGFAWFVLGSFKTVIGLGAAILRRGRLLGWARGVLSRMLAEWSGGHSPGLMSSF